MASTKNKGSKQSSASADAVASSRANVAKRDSSREADASKKGSKAAKQASPKDASKKDSGTRQKDAKAKSKKDAKPGVFARIRNYFADVRTEVKRVVWPSKNEMVRYTVAVILMLVFFGVLIYLADSIILPLLYAFSGLRG
ncbi:MAG: preprotein translocase subunit SecE [Coriobacteriales bacterium]|jgi:preprotein translocase subunit SecE